MNYFVFFNSNYQVKRKTPTIILRLLFLLYCGTSYSNPFQNQIRQNQTSVISNIKTDVLVYDSTPSAIIASIAAAREGLHVVMVTEDKHIGGMRTSGLSMPNLTVRESLGGLGKEFHDRIFKYYVSKYGKESKQVNDCDYGFLFEPHVAEYVFLEMLLDAGVEILCQENIISIKKDGPKIISVQTDRNRKISASIYIDASYEGDLLKIAECSYRIGREGKEEYGESLAGITYPPEKQGHASDKIQRYVYRVVLTNNKENQVPISKPNNYHRATYMIDAAFFIENPPTKVPLSINMVPNNKTDIRVGEGWIGGSHEWPEATTKERKIIEEEHRDYAQGYLWFLLNDNSVPQEVQIELEKWGYAKDEFVDNNNWPYHLYVREARRLVGDFVMCQNDILNDRLKPDGVAIGSFMLDVHPVQYVPLNDEIGGLYSKGGFVREGGVAQQIKPYEIPYRVMLPKRHEVENLLVSICVSSTSIAYSTIRMEPVYMMLGHAAGIAATMSIKSSKPVHDISIEELRNKLINQKAVLDSKPFQN